MNEETWKGWKMSGDLCVCCRINSSLFIRSPSCSSSHSPGRWQDTATPDAYTGKAQHRLPRTHLICLALPLTSPPPPLSRSLSLSLHTDVSRPSFPCSRPSMLSSANSSISFVSHIAFAPVSSLSLPSSFILYCFTSSSSVPSLSFKSSDLCLSLRFSQTRHLRKACREF